MRHELRAPLAVIYPLVSLLRDGVDELSAEHREFLEVLERNVVRLEALIAGVVDSGWADCSAAEAIPGDVSLGDVAEEVVALRALDDRGDRSSSSTPARRRRRAPGRTATTCARSSGTSCATPWRTRRATAAWTSMSADGADAGTVTLEVADTGPGMPPEELARAFEFGFRGELARRLRAPGLGAGLWVCRELAARNGGSLRLAAEPAGGVRAMLTLPAAAGRQR